MDAIPALKVRLSPRKPRDVQLHQWVREDSMNVSEIVRDLLYGYYLQRHNGGGMLATLPTTPVSDDREDPNDPLIQNLMGLTFDERM